MLDLYQKCLAHKIPPAVILIATGFWSIPNILDLMYIKIGKCPRFCCRGIMVKLLNGDANRLSCERQNDALTFWRRVIYVMRKGNGY